MRKLLTLAVVCACCAAACNKNKNEESTTPAPGEEHAMTEQRPPEATPGEPTGEPIEAKQAEPTGSETSPTGATEETQLVAGKAEMSDANIIAALKASNEHEVKVGEIVAGKTKRPDVKHYAQMLVKDHGAALKKIDGLASQMAVKPMDSDDVRMMRDQSKEKVARLEGLKGKELDKAFLEMAAEDHRKTLERLDGTLIPAAKNEDLRSLMNGMRPTVQTHLDEAQRLIAEMK